MILHIVCRTCLWIGGIYGPPDLFRTWKDENGNEILDSTNKYCERAISWWIKDRYRSMRGYKQSQSALGVSRLIAFSGNNLARGLRLVE